MSIGTIWSSSPWMIKVGTSNFFRSSVKSVSEILYALVTVLVAAHHGLHAPGIFFDGPGHEGRRGARLETLDYLQPFPVGFVWLILMGQKIEMARKLCRNNRLQRPIASSLSAKLQGDARGAYSPSLFANILL